eukprot:TRINITY_DN51328_c0_g1_i1.p1 TRINITY_DN51328_c0_g1~~TRINITY_DN51328_c0_g1_i1.p1  ORF type:complete len:201 (+),score=54.69 TRINITY_DN51328_c0_g1_i1:91-603(+)
MWRKSIPAGASAAVRASNASQTVAVMRIAVACMALAVLSQASVFVLPTPSSLPERSATRDAVSYEEMQRPLPRTDEASPMPAVVMALAFGFLVGFGSIPQVAVAVENDKQKVTEASEDPNKANEETRQAELKRINEMLEKNKRNKKDRVKQQLAQYQEDAKNFSEFKLPP